MLIVALLYIAVIWLIFFKLHILPWNWPWRIVTVLLGGAIAAGAALGFLTATAVASWAPAAPYPGLCW